MFVKLAYHRLTEVVEHFGHPAYVRVTGHVDGLAVATATDVGAVVSGDDA